MTPDNFENGILMSGDDVRGLRTGRPGGTYIVEPQFAGSSRDVGGEGERPAIGPKRDGSNGADLAAESRQDAAIRDVNGDRLFVASRDEHLGAGVVCQGR